MTVTRLGVSKACSTHYFCIWQPESLLAAQGTTTKLSRQSKRPPARTPIQDVSKVTRTCAPPLYTGLVNSHCRLTSNPVESFCHFLRRIFCLFPLKDCVISVYTRSARRGRSVRELADEATRSNTPATLGMIERRVLLRLNIAPELSSVLFSVQRSAARAARRIQAVAHYFASISSLRS